MNKNQPLFTVATITYNSEKFVKESIESVFSSNFLDFEYIISDDCSTDNTWEIISSYSDPRLKIWKNVTNIGEYNNRNKVIFASTGKYILFVDGDDILYGNTLSNLAKYIVDFNNPGMIWGVRRSDFISSYLPRLFKKDEMFGILYGFKKPTYIIGLSETVFSLDLLKRNFGFNEKFRTSDTFIKKYLSFQTDVLFVERGFMYWRVSPNQATNVVNNSNINFVEGFLIDKHIFSIYPNEYIWKKILGSFIRRLIINFFIRGNFSQFYKIHKHVNLKIKDYLFAFYRYGNVSNAIEESFIVHLKD